MNPVHIFADFCVDTGLFGDSAWILAPGDNALKRPITDQRATRVALGVGRERANQGGEEAVGEGKELGPVSGRRRGWRVELAMDEAGAMGGEQ